MSNFERLGIIQLELEKLQARANQLVAEKNELMKAIIEEEQKSKVEPKEPTNTVRRKG